MRFGRRWRRGRTSVYERFVRAARSASRGYLGQVADLLELASHRVSDKGFVEWVGAMGCTHLLDVPPAIEIPPPLEYRAWRSPPPRGEGCAPADCSGRGLHLMPLVP